MAIADTITSMQTHTSNAYTMIGYGTDLTGINKNLENLSTSIFNAFLEALRTPDTLFTNLPKKSGTGANITLNDTANAPMRISLSASELTQDATPTPSSPQAVHTISGSNKVVVNGKNLFDKSTIESGKEISNGTIYNNSSWCVSDYIVVEYNQTYIKNINNGNDCIIYDKDKNQISANDRRFSSNKITINEQNAKYIRVNLPLSNLDTYQLEKGSTATTYEPYISQEADIDLDTLEYCKIGNYEDKFIRTSGKNLFDKSTETIGYTIGTSDGIVNVVASDRNTSDFISVKGSTNYTCSATMTRIAYYNSSKTFISSALAQTSITTPSNASYMRFSYDNTLNNIMLNKGTTALDYEPYGSNEWYIKKNIGKVVLDGSETWTNKNITDNNLLFSTSIIDNLFNSLTTTNILSNRFKVISNLWDNDNQGILLFNLSYSLRLRIDKNLLSNISTANDAINSLKTWLSSNNATVYYILSTPTYTQITGTLETQLENVYQKLLSYSGTTNISQINNDLSFNLSVSAIEE